jgi:hypothetical protein
VLESDDTAASTLSKAAGQVARIAMVLSYLDWANQHGTPEPEKIETLYVERAIKLVEGYFQPHAQRVHMESRLPGEDSKAGILAKHIRREKMRTFNAREVRRLIFGKTAKDAEDMTAACQHLVDAFLIWPAAKAKAKKGRPSSNYESNPLIWATAASEGSAA